MSDISSASEQNTPLVLVVDDDQSMRTLLKLAMEEEGYRVAQAKDGEQCLAEFTRLQPDMVLLDAMMPLMDGFTCCQRLRELPGGDRTPILTITVLDDRASVDRAFAAGTTDYVTKPIHWAVLSQRVRRLLAASQTLVKAERATKQLGEWQAWEQLFREIVQTLSGGVILQEFLRAIVADIQVFLQVERAVLCRLGNAIVAESVTPGHASVEKLSLQDFGFLREYEGQYQQGKVVAIADLGSAGLPEEAIAPLIQLKTNAVLIAPILVRGQLWGLLCAHSSRVPHDWDLWEIERFSDLANLLAIAIDNC